MEDGLVRIYETLAEAETARDALLASGFPAARLQLTTNADEAGPVEGDFVSGNAKDGSAGDDSYERNFAEVVKRGVFVLAIEAHGAEEFERVERVLEGLGGIDVDDRIARTAT